MLQFSKNHRRRWMSDIPKATKFLQSRLLLYAFICWKVQLEIALRQNRIWRKYSVSDSIWSEMFICKHLLGTKVSYWLSCQLRLNLSQAKSSRKTRGDVTTQVLKATKLLKTTCMLFCLMYRHFIENFVSKIKTLAVLLKVSVHLTLLHPFIIEWKN